MNKEIHQLSSDVVDKIAAGEVVERPAHLLKELIENSLDAGADQIEVDIDEGGKSLKVTDNGKGVRSEELPLVFARHATSKIDQSDDLWNLSTFGFRGEAIASISSVSRLKFLSLRQGENQAYRIDCEFGKLSPVTETSLSQGTQVQVEELFSNIPARLKFLKSDSAEVTQIKNVLKAMALQYPMVDWKVRLKGKLLFFWKKTDSLLERAQAVLETKNLFSHQKDFDGYKVNVVFSDPATVVKVSRQIWLFVQNRWVQDKTLQAAVMEAYRSLLMHGQYPICYVSLQCPPDEVDVNIHPTKSQVKFMDSKKAFRAVHYCLREAIEQAPWLGRKSKNQDTFAPIQEVTAAPLEFQQKDFQRTQFQQKRRWEPAPSATNPSMMDLRRAAQEGFEGAVVDRPTGSDHASSVPEAYWSSLQVIGQVDLTYIVAQAKDRLLLVDQ
ncbi:MAG: DNA mismatch repair endonuclease MutL, partial [Bdellovibrionales bacterium]|nr:DNA mismatch repair endonuclease MutL [Bdellovibrionales bacterium]